MSSDAAAIHQSISLTKLGPWRRRFNEEWHERALQAYMVVVLAHWAEHLFQAFQVYVLHWPVPEARGLLGLYYPWLVKSEAMHYAYALVMLIGLWFLRPGFSGRSYFWWTVSLWIQFWHHFEHAILQGQAIVGQNLFGHPVPVSLVQLWIPRVELHLFYNTVVFVPMVIGMYFHMWPSEEEAKSTACSCTVASRRAQVA